MSVQSLAMKRGVKNKIAIIVLLALAVGGNHAAETKESKVNSTDFRKLSLIFYSQVVSWVE